MYAADATVHPKHTASSEVSNQFLKASYTIFKPIDDRRNSYIIHLYKKIGNESALEATMENAIWQIYSQRYLNSVLSDIISLGKIVS